MFQRDLNPGWICIPVSFLNVGHVSLFQGAKCFDYDASLQLLVTGGCDRAVRLWTRYVTTRPVVTLPGHKAAILDVAIYQPVGQIFSYSRDAVSLTDES